MTAVRVHADLEALARAAAAEVAAAATAAVHSRGLFSLVLAGGATPRRLYRTLASPPWRDAAFWPRTVVVQGDERAVPPDHPDSNFKMQWEELLGRVPLVPGNVVRFAAEGRDHEAVARQFEAMVRARLGAGPGEIPAFDLVLLGMGADGHTASLFPGSTALAPSGRLAVAVRVGALASWRYTLTLEALAAARAVRFLVAGADKAGAVRQALAAGDAPDAPPAARVRPRSGDLAWLLDEAAAPR